MTQTAKRVTRVRGVGQFKAAPCMVLPMHLG